MWKCNPKPHKGFAFMSNTWLGLCPSLSPVQCISCADKYLCSVILIFTRGLNIVKLDITSIKQHKTKHQYLEWGGLKRDGSCSYQIFPQKLPLPLPGAAQIGSIPLSALQLRFPTCVYQTGERFAVLPRLLEWKHCKWHLHDCTFKS